MRHMTRMPRAAEKPVPFGFGGAARRGAGRPKAIEWQSSRAKLAAGRGAYRASIKRSKEVAMRKRSDAIRKTMLMGVSALVLGWAWPALTAEVTHDRLANPDKEPHNWLMNHRSYDAQRFSPLAKINKDNVRNLKLAFAVAIGGTSANENLQPTPHVEQ